MQFYSASTQLPPFLPYPRFLLEIPVSETARLVYSLILSRIKLSQSNGWADSQGRVFCRYTIGDLMADTGKSKTTILTALGDLEKQDLLRRCRGGAGYANQLYLRLPESCTWGGPGSLHDFASEVPSAWNMLVSLISSHSSFKLKSDLPLSGVFPGSPTEGVT